MYSTKHGEERGDMRKSNKQDNNFKTKRGKFNREMDRSRKIVEKKK